MAAQWDQVIQEQQWIKSAAERAKSLRAEMKPALWTTMMQFADELIMNAEHAISLLQKLQQDDRFQDVSASTGREFFVLLERPHEQQKRRIGITCPEAGIYKIYVIETPDQNIHDEVRVTLDEAPDILAHYLKLLQN